MLTLYSQSGARHARVSQIWCAWGRIAVNILAIPSPLNIGYCEIVHNTDNIVIPNYSTTPNLCLDWLLYWGTGFFVGMQSSCQLRKKVSDQRMAGSFVPWLYLPCMSWVGGYISCHNYDLVNGVYKLSCWWTSTACTTVRMRPWGCGCMSPYVSEWRHNTCEIWYTEFVSQGCKNMYIHSVTQAEYRGHEKYQMLQVVGHLCEKEY